MSIFEKISGFVSRTQLTSSRSFWIYVVCHRCGEKIRSRVDLYSDLSIRYDEDEGSETYYSRKMLVGNQTCFFPIEVELTFNKRRQLIDRSISGGDFITEEAYQETDTNLDPEPPTPGEMAV